MTPAPACCVGCSCGRALASFQATGIEGACPGATPQVEPFGVTTCIPRAEDDHDRGMPGIGEGDLGGLPLSVCARHLCGVCASVGDAPYCAGRGDGPRGGSVRVDRDCRSCIGDDEATGSRLSARGSRPGETEQGPGDMERNGGATAEPPKGTARAVCVCPPPAPPMLPMLHLPGADGYGGCIGAAV